MRSTAWIVALGLFLPSAALAQQPSSPHSDPAAEQAESIASRAFEVYGKGDYAAALALYQQVLKITPAAAIYFNVGNIFDKKLGDPKQAIEYYRKCVAAPDVTAELSLKASARIEALRQDLAQKQAATPEVSAKPEKSAKAEDVVAPPPPADPSKMFKIGGGVALGVGAVALGVGLGFGADALTKVNRAKEVCEGARCTTQAGVDDMAGAGSSATASTALVLVGAVSAAVGVTLFVFAARKAPREPAKAGLRLSPIAGPSQAGLTLSGSFF